MIYLIFVIYILLINLIAFGIMYLDKNKAKKGKYRIREKTIFLIAFLLGGVGVYIGMYKFRHKTKHMTFTVGIPLCIILNILSIIYIIYTKALIYLSQILKI